MSDKFAVVINQVNQGTLSKTQGYDALLQVLQQPATPALGDGPDEDGYYGSHRHAVDGIDPQIPGNPGYADYAGLGNTRASLAQAERNVHVDMTGGAIAHP